MTHEIEEQLAELRAMLASASGHRRVVVRPNVKIGTKELTGEKWAGMQCDVFGPGPVTAVTFFISDCVGTETQ